MKITAEITAKNVYYQYSADSSLALNNINLTIKPGEFVAIIGPNGSGKSTLAKLFNGIFVPTKGDVFVDGLNTKDKDKIWEIRRKAGMVFQNPDNQIVATVVEEDVAFGPENLGVAPEEIRRRIDEALEPLNLLNLPIRLPTSCQGSKAARWR